MLTAWTKTEGNVKYTDYNCMQSKYNKEYYYYQRDEE